ncbi:MAG TPA: DUF2846 domain-containing protein [Candidatus Acidoferrum sp.]|nr:DUF2846 domain-containing protein [Candidatus Acidoferrum sp.]
MLRILIVALLLGLPTYTQAQSSEDHSAGGCGSSKDGWDVKTVKEHPPAPKPADGKALVYVVQTMVDAPVIGGNKATTRLGVDGMWIGANHGNSYFFFPVDPGEHSICTDWQSALYTRSGLASAADLNAQAGRTYYFRIRVRDVTNYRPGDVEIGPLDTSEARLLLGNSEFASSHPKK